MPNKVGLLDRTRTYISDFCVRYEYPEEARQTFLEAFDRIRADAEFGSKFFRTHKIYSVFPYVNLFSPLGEGKLCDKVAKKLRISRYTVEFLFFLCLTPSLERHYVRRGIPLSIFYQSMNDLKCKLWECKKMYNVWGSFVASWFPLFFYLRRFALGRLQYEPIPLGFKYKLDFGGIKTNVFTKWLNIHIPSSGPLSPAEVEESFRLAYTFFRGRGYGKNIVYYTTSWLLSPDHKSILPTSSNIVRFAENFRLVFYNEEQMNKDFWRIFYRDFDPKNPDCSGDSALQKGYKTLIGEGKHILHGDGAFVFNGERFIK